jgi:hypothetical protein
MTMFGDMLERDWKRLGLRLARAALMPEPCARPTTETPPTYKTGLQAHLNRRRHPRTGGPPPVRSSDAGAGARIGRDVNPRRAASDAGSGARHERPPRVDAVTTAVGRSDYASARMTSQGYRGAPAEGDGTSAPFQRRPIQGSPRTLRTMRGR